MVKKIAVCVTASALMMTREAGEIRGGGTGDVKVSGREVCSKAFI